MRKEQTRSRTIDRRRLLQGAGLAAGAAASSSAVAKDGLTAAAQQKAPAAGYRETEDVKAYYKSARY